jgi:hypothetical protein
MPRADLAIPVNPSGFHILSLLACLSNLRTTCGFAEWL